ncbi:MAG TPA: sodium:solute symporter [Acidobacteriota bacterium]|nr:sodium:solute symporter [Acidobacteriota bacterium]
MSYIDWSIIIVYLVYVVYDGIKRSRETDNVRGYFLANRSLPWWAVGLSVMATQMSAITLVGTTGQAYDDGMRFIQFYFGLPFAMIVLCVTVVRFFHQADVYTAYEYLEQRFDAKTRSLTSFFFLLSRGLSCGVIIAAPAVILSIIMGWNLQLTVLAIGLPTVLYTMLGGVQAVTWTDVKQMILIFVGMAASVIAIMSQLPPEVDLGRALLIAGATGRVETIDFSFNLNETYTFWSGLLGGFFLMLSYFGCDQSQVQRFLTARSIDQGRMSLLMSAFLKIPVQFVILLIGVLVFVFYNFQAPPITFNPEVQQTLEQSHLDEIQRIQERYDRSSGQVREAALRLVRENASSESVAAYREAYRERQSIRERGVQFIKGETGNSAFNDVNYVFPTFITHHMPIGFVGLLIAAIFAAAMSSISSELNALSTATVIDFYRRHIRKDATDAHYLRFSKLATAFWGLMACLVAMYAAHLGSLIEVVNRFGSFFYGSLLGVFILAFGFRSCTATGAFIGLLAGMTSVAFVSITTSISFLWYNIVGAGMVVLTGITISSISRRLQRT